MTSQGRKPSSREKRIREVGQTLPTTSRGRVASPRKSTGVERRVRDVLIPVEPSQQFVRELGHGLSAAAIRSRQSLARRYRTAIVIGVAIFGSLASMVGVVALIVRQRSRMRTELSS